MIRKPIRMLVAIAAIVLAGFAVATLAQDHGRPVAAIADMNHGNVKFGKGEERRILNAIAATNASKSRDELVAQGRRVFRDGALFEHGESCQTCHAEGAASPNTGTMVHDTQQTTPVPGHPELATPPNDFDGPRDPPSLFGIAKTPPFFWNGDVKTLNAALIRPVLGHMKRFVPGGAAGDCETLPRSSTCDQAIADLAAALEAYVRTLDPPVSAFDEGTMSPAAKRGERIFQGQGGCIECHGGPLFTDNLEHNTGVPQVTFKRYSDPPGTQTLSHDLGAPPPPLAAECLGANPAFGCDPPRVTVAGCPPANTVKTPATPQGRCSPFINTPMMRDLKNSAPYMHNGAFKSLADVVKFYNEDSALAPLNLNAQQAADLVAYLESL